jgi:hypothetical protein
MHKSAPAEGMSRQVKSSLARALQLTDIPIEKRIEKVFWA